MQMAPPDGLTRSVFNHDRLAMAAATGEPVTSYCQMWGVIRPGTDLILDWTSCNTVRARLLLLLLMVLLAIKSLTYAAEVPQLSSRPSFIHHGKKLSRGLVGVCQPLLTHCLIYRLIA